MPERTEWPRNSRANRETSAPDGRGGNRRKGNREPARDAAHPSLDVPAETGALATITIVGGAYHEVRRIFAALGSHVLGLCRVSFGDVELPRDLAPGEYQLLSNEGRR